MKIFKMPYNDKKQYLRELFVEHVNRRLVADVAARRYLVIDYPSHFRLPIRLSPPDR